MEELARARLESLRKELDAGEAELQKLETRRTYLRETLLRIDGAIQVLQELLTKARPAVRNGVVASDTGLALESVE
jgi:hypothetical protein